MSFSTKTALLFISKEISGELSISRTFRLSSDKASTQNCTQNDDSKAGPGNIIVLLLFMYYFGCDIHK